MSPQERAERSRESILDAAAVEFDAHGYAGTRLERIVERTSLTKGAVYFHFRSKRELAETLVGERCERLSGVVAGVSGGGLRGLAAAAELIRLVGEMVVGDVRVRAALKLSRTEFAATVGESWYAAWTAALEGYLRQAVEAGELAPGVEVRELAVVTVQALLGAFVIADERGRLESLGADIERLWILLLPLSP